MPLDPTSPTLPTDCVTITLQVNHCRDCPFFWHDDGDGESPWESDHCSKLDNKDVIFPLKILPDCPYRKPS